jgi:hypothetical protein
MVYSRNRRPLSQFGRTTLPLTKDQPLQNVFCEHQAYWRLHLLPDEFAVTHFNNFHRSKSFCGPSHHDLAASCTCSEWKCLFSTDRPLFPLHFLSLIHYKTPLHYAADFSCDRLCHRKRASRAQMLLWSETSDTHRGVKRPRRFRRSSTGCDARFVTPHTAACPT